MTAVIERTQEWKRTTECECDKRFTVHRIRRIDCNACNAGQCGAEER